MAAFIKRLLKNEHKEPRTHWASLEEREKFERERENWKTDMISLLML